MRWFADSLLFSSFAQYQDMSGISGASSAAITWNAGHPSGRRSALRTSRGLGITAVQPPPALDFISTVFVGCWVRFSNAGTATETLFYTRDVSLNQQTVVQAVSTSTGVYLQFSAQKKILVTPELAKDEWHYLEIKIVHHATEGEIEVRTGGGRLALARNTRTVQFVSGGSLVHGIVWPEAASTFINDFADFYVCDELVDGSPFSSFLGPSEFLPLVAAGDLEVSWTYAPESGRLLIMAGQSNMTGRGTSSKPAATTKVRYWDQFFGGIGQVLPGSNTSGMMTTPPSSLGYWGPEVRVCERIDASTAPGHITYLVKASQDASTPYPLDIAGYSWFKDFTHDLTDKSGLPTDNCLFNYVRDLVAAELGGDWSLLTDVTMVWYQGETDAILPEMAINWSYYFTEFLNYVKASVNPSAATDIKLILVRIHEDTASGYTSTVHQQQTNYPADVMISVDDLTLTDGYHLAESDLETLGDRIFEAWMRLGRTAAGLLDDFRPPGQVGLGLSAAGAASAEFVASGLPAVRPVMHMVRKAAYSASSAVTLRADLSELPQDPLPAPGTETAFRDTLDSVEVPEKVTSSTIQVTQE